MTKTRPILFNAEMIRALLDGRKTQTRRQIKNATDINWHTCDSCGARSYTLICRECGDIEWSTADCPYGEPGDLLWVKETFANTEQAGEDPSIVYRATDPDWGNMEGWKWKPSIFMPRAASRITLKITDIRVENVQSITWNDAVAEGMSYEKGYQDPREVYKRLWNSINGNWDENPWVWVIGFEVVHGNVVVYE